MRVLSCICLASLLSIGGCRSTKDLPAPVVGRNGLSPARSIDADTTGILLGKVHFKGKAPARIPIDMTMDPACSFAAENLSEPYVVNGGKLANVYVYVKGIAPSKAARDAPTVVLDQKGCRYLPHVIAVQQGGSVEFRNSDLTMHNVHTMPTAGGNAAMDVSEGPHGTPETRRFDAVETMMPVRCNNHPWMNAFVNVAPSPYFAVTGADGSFTLKGVPAGTYTLAAVHEKLGEQDIQVTVPAKGRAEADFTYAAK